jgi:hypothetical protein
MEIGARKVSVLNAVAGGFLLIFSMGCSSESRDGDLNRDLFISGNVTTSQDVSLGNFFITCQTLEESPRTASGKISGSGSFNFELKYSKGTPIHCFIVSLLDDYVGTVVFKDTSAKDLNGNDVEFPYIEMDSDTELAIAMDFGSGKGVADISTITTLETLEPVAWDLTGTWKWSSLGITLPPKLSDLCEAGQSQYTLGSAATCWGPEVDQTFYFKQFSGLDSSSATVDAVMGWKDSASNSACGSRIGSTYADLETASQVDFSTSGVTEGAFTFVTTLNGTDSLTDFWKSNAAQSAYPILNCAPYKISGVTYWRCSDGSSGNHRIEQFQGCANESLTPLSINIANWSSVTWGASTPTDDDDFKLNTMAGTFNGGAISCLSRFAYTDGSDTINNTLPFDWNNVGTAIAQAQPCSNINGASYPLAKLKCYERHYKNQIISANGCVKELHFNGAANSENDFVLATNKPKNLYFYNRVVNGNDGLKTLSYENSEILSVEYKDSNAKVGFAFCPVVHRTTISILPTDLEDGQATQAIAVFQNETIMDSTLTVCRAHMVNTLKGSAYVISDSRFALVARQKVLANISRSEN